MTFRRFLAWIVEKLFELQLFIIALIAVKFILPTGVHSFESLDAFVAGAREQWFSSLDEASYMTRAFMGGSYAMYGLRTYQAAAYVIGIHFYFWSFYLFTSIFACLAGERGYVQKAVLAFWVSAGVLAYRQRDMLDLQSIYLAAALLTGGTVVVILAALFGKWVDFRLSGGKSLAEMARNAHDRKQQSVRGRVRFDLSQ